MYVIKTVYDNVHLIKKFEDEVKFNILSKK